MSDIPDWFPAAFPTSPLGYPDAADVANVICVAGMRDALIPSRRQQARLRGRGRSEGAGRSSLLAQTPRQRKVAMMGPDFILKTGLVPDSAGSSTNERQGAMLSALTTKSRFKAAAALALLYAFCVLAPSAALAFADREATAHCLTEPHGHAGMHQHAQHVHKHADGKAHGHDEGGAAHHSSDDKAQAAKCCGLFCLTALATTHVPLLGKLAGATALLPAVHTGLAGRGPDRINRPPIS